MMRKPEFLQEENRCLQNTKKDIIEVLYSFKEHMLSNLHFLDLSISFRRDSTCAENISKEINQIGR